jgi:hypothetical protein
LLGREAPEGDLVTAIGLIGLACRALVGAVFALTAIWKASNRLDFEASFDRLAPTRATGSARLVLWPLVATELALALALPLGVRVEALALVAPVAAFLLIASFTLALAGGEQGACGCWSAPSAVASEDRLVPILRNVVLLVVLAGAVVLSPHAVSGLTATASLAPLATGLIVALLLVEAPQIVAVATFERRLVRSDGAQ